MTQQNEVNAALDRQLKALHIAAHRVWAARGSLREIRARVEEMQANGKSDSVMAVGLCALALALLVFDFAAAGPALLHRFQMVDLPEELAWVAAFLVSVLLMFVELVLAISIFNATQRALITKQHGESIGLKLLAVGATTFTVLLGISQLIAMSPQETDWAILLKESALIVLLGLAHLLLIFRGRYMEPAKREIARLLEQSCLGRRERKASKEERKQLNAVADEYRVHLRSVGRARAMGLAAELGPFEDAALDLIRERHANVDEMIAKYATQESKPVPQRISIAAINGD